MKRVFIYYLIGAFLGLSIGPFPQAQADLLVLPDQQVALPKIEYPLATAIVKGLTIHPENPLQFDFIVEPNVGNGFKPFPTDDIKSESLKMIKYFLASLTTPEKDMWVNLSPYEKNRIIPEEFGSSLMGRDLLAQDYILKQMTASLIHPDTQLGKEFWSKVYAQAQAKYGTTNIPINTFNKVWIMPDKATVWEHGQSVFVIERHLKVMLEQDYLSMSKQDRGKGYGVRDKDGNLTPDPLTFNPNEDLNNLGSQIVREIVIPALENEVNKGDSFAQLRQIYNAMILATWYKKRLKDSLLGTVYVDKNKMEGISFRVKGSGLRDKKSQPTPYPLSLSPNDIYNQYLQTFKKGVFNFIKEESDPTTGEMIPRKYFSGGMVGLKDSALVVVMAPPHRIIPTLASDVLPSDKAMKVTFNAVSTSSDKPLSDNAMQTSFMPKKQKEELANNLEVNYVLDAQKAKRLAMLLRQKELKHEKTADGYDLYRDDNGKKIVEIGPAGTKRFFDEEQQWILTLDPFGNKTDELQWGNGDFENLWTRNINGYVLRMDNRYSVQQSFVYFEGDKGRTYPDYPILTFDSSPNFLRTAKYIPAAGDPGIGNSKAKGAGPTMLAILSYLARDKGNQLSYVGDIGRPVLFYTLKEVTNTKSSLSEFESHPGISWQPAPPEKLFNPNGLYLMVRNNVLQRVVYKGTTFFNTNAIPVDREGSANVKPMQQQKDRFELLLKNRRVLIIDHLGNIIEDPNLEEVRSELELKKAQGYVSQYYWQNMVHNEREDSTTLSPDTAMQDSADEAMNAENSPFGPLSSKEYEQKVEIAIGQGLDYEEAKVWRDAKLKSDIRFPRGFWRNENTARNFIYLALDTISGFKEAREKNDIKTMADLYRKYVIGYKAKDNEKYQDGQQGFFYEAGCLRGLMANTSSFLNKSGSAAALLQFALPNLIDIRNSDALDPIEVEHGYWTQPENVRYHIFLALDAIPGFQEARRKNDIKTMANLYRKHVIGYQIKDKQKYPENGQLGFFYELGGLQGIMSGSVDFLVKRGSPAALLRFVLPELIDVRNPDALDPLEVERNYWNNPANAKYHIFLALDTILGFKEAREKNDIKVMAELYRKHVIEYKNGQIFFFYKVGGLSGLVLHPREFLDKQASSAALLRFALPALVDQGNPDALRSKEIEYDKIQSSLSKPQADRQESTTNNKVSFENSELELHPIEGVLEKSFFEDYRGGMTDVIVRFDSLQVKGLQRAGKSWDQWKALLGEALWETLKNSLQGREKQVDIQRHIKINVEKIENKLSVIIQDDGQGMESSYFQKLRVSLDSVRGVSTRPSGGGAGLNIIVGNINKIGGKVTIENRPIENYSENHGVTYTFEIPIDSAMQVSNLDQAIKEFSKVHDKNHKFQDVINQLRNESPSSEDFLYNLDLLGKSLGNADPHQDMITYLHNFTAWKANVASNRFVEPDHLEELSKFSLQSDSTESTKPRRIYFEKPAEKDMQLMEEWVNFPVMPEVQFSRNWNESIRDKKDMVAIVSKDDAGKKHLEGWVSYDIHPLYGLYINFIEIAPWHRQKTEGRALNGVGTLLVAKVMNESLRLGFKGRVFTNAATHQGVKLFEHLGATKDLGIETDTYTVYPFYYFTSAAAQEIIKVQNNMDGNLIVEDQAMNSSEVSKDLGGIDMNSNLLDLSIKRDGQGLPLPSKEQNWTQLQISGLEPVIIKIEPFDSHSLFSYN